MQAADLKTCFKTGHSTIQRNLLDLFKAILYNTAFFRSEFFFASLDAVFVAAKRWIYAPTSIGELAQA